MSSGRHKLPAGGTQQRSDDLTQEAAAFFFPLCVWEWWAMGYEEGRGAGVRIRVRRGCMSTLTDPCAADWRGEGAADVSPVKRRIANTVDGDGWKTGWVSGREKGPRGRGRRKGTWRGPEEAKRWKYEEILARKLTKGNRGRRAEKWGM